MVVDIFITLLGLVIVTVGAEALVKGASRFAARLGVSPLVIGLTIVAFGTSAPELTVSLFSALQGKGDLAIGNVIGSNIFNILFILGGSALITPLNVSWQLIKLDVPIMVGVSFLTVAMAYNGLFSQLEGLTLVAIYLAYTLWLIREAKKTKKGQEVYSEFSEEYDLTQEQLKKPWFTDVLLVVGGFLGLVLGTKFFVEGAVQMARFLGVSETVIGLTIVAAGTSMPEVATSFMAAKKGEKDIAVGNVVGSNIFNILGVLGLSSFLSPRELIVVKSVASFDFPVMLLVALACVPIFWTGKVVARWEGGLFFFYFLAYTTYTILVATNHSLTQTYANAFCYVLLPLTFLVLVVSVIRSKKETKKLSP